ncbi:MAG: hypothetical protein P1R58_07575, partial [bacterium]|nr:hypothetical protein [bacterium]
MISTDSTVYYFGETVNITGEQYWTGEDVSVDLTDQYGFVVDSWSVYSDPLGGFLTKWVVPLDGSFGDSLTLSATGESSGLIASTSIVSPKTYLNQMQNGTSSSTAEWSNGNINTSNSCYVEGSSVSYRFFVKDLDSADQHFIDITYDASKGGIHAIDYLTDYDLTEFAAIAASGGACGTIATSPPTGCTTPTETLAFPDPSDSANYLSIPGDMAAITGGSFIVSGPRNLSAYNVTLDSTGLYTFGGSTSDRTITIRVYFTVDDYGSAGFFWAGHLAEGTASTWGTGNGASSVSGAPYHMSVLFDGGGGAQDRSIQGITQCIPPTVSLSCAVADSLCADSIYTCSATSGADSYDWTVTGGSIISGQGTSSITYAVDGSGTYSDITIIVSACDSVTECATLVCCAADTAIVPIGDCSIPCVVTLSCPSDITLECDQSIDTSVTGTATYSTTGECGTLTLSYTDQTAAGACTNESVITRTWSVVEDGTDTLANCQQIITLQDTTAPVFDQACPADITVACDAIPTAPTLTATDNCGVGTVSYTETTTAGSCANSYSLTRQWVASDECGNADTCVQVITVEDNSAPVFDQTCPADVTVACDAVPTAPTMTATDNCDLAATVTYNESSVPGACTGDYVLTRTWIAADTCGNADTCTQVITVQDNSPPTFDLACPADITVECDAVPSPPNMTATDACDPAPTVVYTETILPAAGNYTISRMWVAADDCGNADTCLQVITVQDNTPPQFV